MMNLKEEQLTIEEVTEELNYYEYVLENHEALEIKFDSIENYPAIIENVKAELLDLYIEKGNKVELEISSHMDTSEHSIESERYLMLELIATGPEAEEVFNLAGPLFKQELDSKAYTMGAGFSSFPIVEENYYSDIIDVPFQYGGMGEIKKQAKQAIKTIA